MAVNPVPKGYEGATPYLAVQDAAAALDFYRRAFGAVELMRMAAPDGKIGHAEIRIGDHAIVMLADEWPGTGMQAPPSLGGTSVHIMVYVPDVDRFAAHAEAAGAKVLRPVANQFYGDRTVTLTDPFGHSWTFATHVEDVAPDDLERRARAAMQQAG